MYAHLQKHNHQNSNIEIKISVYINMNLREINLPFVNIGVECSIWLSLQTNWTSQLYYWHTHFLHIQTYKHTNIWNWNMMKKWDIQMHQDASEKCPHLGNSFISIPGIIQSASLTLNDTKASKWWFDSFSSKWVKDNLSSR